MRNVVNAQIKNITILKLAQVNGLVLCLIYVKNDSKYTIKYLCIKTILPLRLFLLLLIPSKVIEYAVPYSRVKKLNDQQSIFCIVFQEQRYPSIDFKFVNLNLRVHNKQNLYNRLIKSRRCWVSMSKGHCY